MLKLIFHPTSSKCFIHNRTIGYGLGIKQQSINATQLNRMEQHKPHDWTSPACSEYVPERHGVHVVSPANSIVSPTKHWVCACVSTVSCTKSMWESVSGLFQIYTYIWIYILQKLLIYISYIVFCFCAYDVETHFSSYVLKMFHPQPDDWVWTRD